MRSKYELIQQLTRKEKKKYASCGSLHCLYIQVNEF